MEMDRNSECFKNLTLESFLFQCFSVYSFSLVVFTTIFIYFYKNQYSILVYANVKSK